MSKKVIKLKDKWFKVDKNEYFEAKEIEIGNGYVYVYFNTHVDWYDDDGLNGETLSFNGYLDSHDIVYELWCDDIITKIMPKELIEAEWEEIIKWFDEHFEEMVDKYLDYILELSARTEKWKMETYDDYWVPEY